MEMRAQGFSKEELSICDNITAAVEKLVLCHKALTIYIESDTVYI